MVQASALKKPKRPYGLSDATLRVLESSGYLQTKEREAEYTFQELAFLRTVSALKAAQLPTRTINRALRDLRPRLDGTQPSSSIALKAVAARIRVQDGRGLWEPGTGQYALPLQSVLESNVVPIVSYEKLMKKKQASAHAHYLRGASLEQDDEDLKAARAAYESCLAGDCSHLEARINLGRLLHLEGLLREADAIYKAHEEPSAILFFNWGVLLEDMKRDLDAIEAYRKAIVHDPGIADAHFNLSLLHDRLGQAQAAYRHLLVYHRLDKAHRSNSRKKIK